MWFDKSEDFLFSLVIYEGGNAVDFCSDDMWVGNSKDFFCFINEIWVPMSVDLFVMVLNCWSISPCTFYSCEMWVGKCVEFLFWPFFFFIGEMRVGDTEGYISRWVWARKDGKLSYYVCQMWDVMNKRFEGIW